VKARVDIATLRAVAQSIVDECNHQVDELGPAAHRAVLDRATCRAIIAVIDLADTWPPSPSIDAIPERIRRALDSYQHAGLRPGDCLYAVLTNDLRRAFAFADVEVAASMPAIMLYVNSRLPCECWGSQPIVEAWLRRPRS
jgi:hypothetical protein